MKLILFYHENTSGIGEHFKNSILKNWSGFEMEIFQTLKSLKNRMKNNSSFFGEEVYIVLVDSKRRLLELCDLSHLVEDKNLILILPEESEESMRRAMHLCPRFITRISEGYKDLHLVLQQMTGKERTKENKEPDLKISWTV